MEGVNHISLTINAQTEFYFVRTTNALMTDRREFFLFFLRRTLIIATIGCNPYRNYLSTRKMIPEQQHKQRVLMIHLCSLFCIPFVRMPMCMPEKQCMGGASRMRFLNNKIKIMVCEDGLNDNYSKFVNWRCVTINWHCK